MHATVLRVARGARLLSALAFAVTACDKSTSTLEPDGSTTTPLVPVVIDHGTHGAVEVFLDTYDGSGQAVHPDVVVVPGGYQGYDYWMAVTPYRDGAYAVENASVYQSHDGLAWAAPHGVNNPVVPAASGEVLYNSDPDLVYLAGPRRLVLFNRAVTATSNLLQQTWSDDGVHWSPLATVLQLPNHQLISPSVALAPAHRPRLWYVDAGTAGCVAQHTTVWMRRWIHDTTGTGALIGAGWSHPVATDLVAPADLILWHLDVAWVAERSEYWAIFPAHAPRAHCNQDDLFVARSRDGLHWTTLQEPLIARGTPPITAGSVYRSTLVYDAAASEIRVWFSGRADDGTWHLGYQSFAVGELAMRLDRQVR